VPVAKLLGRRAVPSALAIGAMIPDAWYFVPLLERGHAHDVPGVLWFCLPAGLMAYVAFHIIFKQPMLALLPRTLAGRLAAWTAPRLPAVPWPWVLLSLLAGIATHLAWDAFTHEGDLPILLDTRVFGGVHLHRVLQHGSTLAGTVFLAWWAWHKLRATQPKAAVRELRGRVRVAVVGAMIAFPAMAFFSVLHAFDGQALNIALRAAGVVALSAFGLLALSFSIAWKRWLV
jgi:hypothetical protein